MRMSKESYDKMQVLIQKCFDGNACLDNLAYNLDFHYFNKIGDILHQKVAHMLPQWADLVSDEMLILSARPVRLEVARYSNEYTKLVDIFGELLRVLLDIRSTTIELIEIADYNGNDEVRIFGEDFLENIKPYIKQAEEWLNAAQILSPEVLNIHIQDYTHFIAL